MTKEIRLNLTDKAWEQFNELRELLGETTIHGTVRHSMSLALYIIREKKKGNKIIIESEKGRIIKTTQQMELVF